MRKITLIIIHCSATPEGRNLDFETCRHDHIHHRGFKDIGYHFYITRDGGIHRGRSLERIGAHCKNHNRHSVGICYKGGLSAGGIPADTRTLEQKAALLALLRELRAVLPEAIIVGHRDLNPLKGCPCFDAVKEYGGGVKTAPYFNYVSTKTNKSTPLSYISCISSSIARYTVVFPDFISTK